MMREIYFIPRITFTKTNTKKKSNAPGGAGAREGLYLATRTWAKTVRNMITLIMTECDIKIRTASWG